MSIRNITVALFALVLSCRAVGAFAENSEVEALAKTWAQTNDALVITALYSDDAVLWGTTKDEVIVGHKGIFNYYEEANAKYPGLKAELQDGMITQTFGDTALNTGVYQVTNIEAGKETWSIFLRFTFAYRKVDGQWKIVAHHSSRMPN